MNPRVAKSSLRSSLSRIFAPFWRRAESHLTAPFFERGENRVEVLEARIAPASTVVLSGADLAVTGDAAADTITISIVGADTQFTDPGGITAGAGATQVDAFTVTVPTADFNTLDIATDGGTDSITISSSLSLTSLTAEAETFGNLPSLTIGSGGLDLTASGGSLNVNGVITLDGALFLSATGDININASINKTTGGATTSEFRAHGSIVITGGSDVTSTSGAMTTIFNADRDANSSGGFYITASGTQITTNNADLTIGGGATPASTAVFGPTDKGIYITGATISAGSGNISIRGQGDATSGGGASIGIDLDASTAISTTSGNITLVGTGGAVSDGFTSGVSLYNGASITTAGGAISITGTSNATGSNAYGVKLQLNSKVEATGNGTIAISGTGSASGSGSGNDGIAMFDNADVVSQGAGAITLTATAGAGSQSFNSGSGSNDIQIGTGGVGTYSGDLTISADTITFSNISVAGTGTVTIQPTTTSTTIGLGNTASGTLHLNDLEVAALQNGFSSITMGHASGTGAIDVTALTFNDPLTLRNTGVGSGGTTINGALSTDALTINSAGGITFNAGVTLASGTSLNATTTSTSAGINLATASADLAASGAGAIALTSARDIVLASGSSVSVVNGSATLSANQQMTPTSGNFIGIHVNGGTITTSGTGAVVLSGRGGDDAGTANHNGIRLTSTGLIQSTASGATAGAITLTGTGGSGTDNAQGIYVQGPISTVDGDILLTGTGGAAAGDNSKGIHMNLTGSITSTGTGANAGNITLVGQGNATTAGLFADGVGLPGGSISSVDGDISISGTSFLNNNVGIRLGVGANPVTIQATGDGAITFTGIGSPTATLDDIHTQHAGNIFGAVGGTGGVTFNADTIDLSLGTVQNAGTVTIQPTTAGTTVSLAGSSTLDLTDAELDNITAGNIVIGNGTSGAMTIGGSITRVASTNLTLNAGSNTVTFTSGGGIDAAGGTVTFNSGAVTGSTGTDVASSGGTLVLNTSGAVALTTAVSNLGASTITSGALDIDNTGSLTVSGAVSFASTLTLASSGTLTVGANLTKSSGGAAAATLQAANGVVFNAGVSLTSTSGAMTVVLNGDTDANSAGPVVLNTGAGITSNGGSVTIGGGVDPSTTAAYGSAGVSDMGVSVLGTISSGAGSVSIRGEGLAGAGSSATGVEIGSSLMTTSGSITIVGTGGNAAFASPGVAITANVGSTAGGSVSITGTSTGSMGSSSGIRVAGASVTTTGAGTLTLNGTASTTAANNGVELSNGSISSTGSGAITITAAGALGAAALSTATGTNTIGGASHSGSITINANSVDLSNHNVQTTSTVTIQPTTDATTISFNGASTLDLTTSELTGISASTLIVGSSTGTGAISIAATNLGATNYNLTLRGGAATFTGGITLSASKTATFNTAGITGSGATDVTSSGGTLVLNTTGAVDIDTAVANLGASTVTGGAVDVSNTGSLAVSGAVSFTSDLAFASSGTLTIGANLSKTSGGASTTTLEAANGVVFNAGTSLTSSSGAMAVVLNGDTDANSQGPVLLNTITSITSNGGDVTIGGGANPATTAAFGSAGISEYGVRILGTITAGAGNVSIRGAALSAPTAAAHGVDISTGSGVSGNNITIAGTGGSSAAFATSGVNITKTVTSAGGNVSITGTTTGSLAGLSRGVFIQNTSVTTSGTGTIAVDGTAGGGNNSGVELNNSGNVTSTGSGAITIDGTGSGTGSGLLTGTGTNRIGFNGVSAYTGAVTITADTVALANHNITTSGNTVTIKPDTLTTTVSLNGASTLDLSTSELSGISAATLIVGASGGTGAIGIGSAGQLALGGTNYNLTINGGPVTFSGAVSPILALSSGKTFTFNTNGITGVGGAISDISSSSGTLVLNTTGAVTMRTSVSNFGASTISGGAVTVANTGALTVSGAVGATSALSLSTLNANSALTVAASITTNAALTLATSATTSDIVLGSGGAGDISSTGADISVSAGRTITVNESVTTTGIGNITFSGNSGAGARNIVVNAGAVVSTVDGGLNLDANQGVGIAGTFAGVSVSGSVSVSGTGTLTVAGRGGNTNGAGVLVQSAGEIVAGTAGTATITGIGGATSGAATANYGVRVTGTGSQISSNGANVQVTGTGGGVSTSSGNHGVSVTDAGEISAGGAGTVTVNGTGGGGSGGSNTGVFVGTNSATIASSGGTVGVTGTAGSGTSTAVDVNDSTASINAGAGDATLTGSSLNIAGSVSGANATLIGDSMTISGSVTATGTATLRQNTNGNSINLGGADAPGVLGLTDTELDLVSGATIAIGNANTGGIVVSAALTQGAKDFTFTTSGSISGAGSLAAGSLAASAATGITLSTALDTISATNSTSGNITIAEADGITATSLTTTATNSSISLTTTNGAIAATGAVMATGTGTVTLSAGGTGGVSVTSVTTGTGDISIVANNGSITTTGAVNSGGAGQIAITAGGAGNSLTVGAGVSTGSGGIKFSADVMALNGGANSISSAGTLSIEATTASTSIGLGAGSAGSLNLTGTEIATFADGFSGITIGNAAGSHTIDIDNNGTLTFNDPVTIRTGTAGGSISLASDTPLVGAGNASITLTSAGAVTLDNSITTTNQPIAVNFGQAGGAVNITVGVLNPGASTATVTGGTGANIITLTSTANTLSVVGGGGSDTLVAPNTVNTWDLSANTLNTNVTHSGITTLQGGTSSDTFNINASRTQNLKGGSGTDSFVLSAAVTLTGSVDGEAGTDTLDLSAVAVSVTLSGAGSVDGVAGTIAPASITAGFDNINVLDGSGTFTGANATSTWTVGPTVTYTTGASTVTLTGYTTLQGGSAVDTFNVSNGHSISTINGGAGADIFNMDYSGGSPAIGLTVNGENDGDTLTLSGTTATTITHSFTNDTDGAVDVDGDVLNYTGMETTTDSLGAANRIFNFNGGAETISLTDATGANMTIDSTAASALTFGNPTTSLTINAGTGADTVNITSMDAAYTGTLTVNGGADADNVTISTGLPILAALTVSTDTLAALPALTIGAGGLNLTTTAGDITQSGALSVTGTTTLNSGANAITLTHASNNFVGAVTATATGAGAVSLNDASGGITIAAITAILSSGVTVTATGGGDITTTGAISAASAAVSLTAADAIVLGGGITADTLGLTAGSTITQTAGGISTTGAVTTNSSGDQLLTSTSNSIAALIATNTLLGGDIDVQNGFDGFQIGPITNNDGPVMIDNTNSGVNDATIVGTVNSGGTANGDITISTSGHLMVNAVATTAGGSGGVLTLDGWLTLSATPVLGGGDITLSGGSGDLHILANLTFASSYTLSSQDNVIIEATVATTGASSDLTITADTDLDGSGGVYIKEDGFVNSSRDVTITGSDLATLAFPGEAIRIDLEGTLAVPVVQVQAVRNITMNSSSAAPANVTAIAGYVKNTNTGPTVGNIEFTGPVDIIDNTAFVQASGGGSILFDSTVDSLGGYDLKLQTTLGNINFFAAVGGTNSLGDVTVENVGNLTASSTVSADSLTLLSVDGTATFSDLVTVLGAGGDVFYVQGDTLLLDAVSAPGGGDLFWEVENITLGNTVSGIGELTIRPMTTTRTIGLNGSGSLNLDTTEIGQLQAGFSMITIGRPDGSGTVTTNGASFIDNLTVLVPEGTMDIDGKLETTGVASSITIEAEILNLNVDSALDDVIATVNGTVTIENTAIVLQQDSRINTNSGALGGDVFLTATINGAFDMEIDAFFGAGGGDVTLRGLASTSAVHQSIGGSTRLTSFTVNADDIDTAPHIYTSGPLDFNAQGVITTHGGAHNANNGGSITYNGVVNPVENLRPTATDVTFTSHVLNMNISSYQLAGDLTAGSPVVTNLSSIAGLFIGQQVVVQGFPDGVTIVSIDGPDQVTLSAAAPTTVAGEYLAFGSFGASTLNASAPFGSSTFTLLGGDTSALYIGQPVSGDGIPAGSVITSISHPNSFDISASITTFSVAASITGSTLKATATSGTNSFTLNSGTTGSLAIGQAVTGTYIQPGTVIATITGPTTFTTSLVASSDALSPTAGENSNGAVSITATGQVQFQGNVGVDGSGVAMPLNYLKIVEGDVVSVSGEIYTIGAITLTANELNFNGGPDTIDGSSIVLTASPTVVNVVLGTNPENIASPELELSTDDLDALAYGVPFITIGAHGLTGTLTVDGAVTFKSPTKLYGGSPGNGTMFINDSITILGSAPLELNAKNIDLAANVTSDSGAIVFTSQHQHKTGKVTVSSASTVSSTSGDIAFLAAVIVNDTLTVSTTQGDISTTGTITSTNASDFTMSAAIGSVTFAGIGNGKALSRPGHVQVDSAGTTIFNMVDVDSLATDSAGTTVFRSNVKTWGAAGLSIMDPLTIEKNLTISAKGTGGITFGDVVESDATPRILLINTVSGAVHAQDHIGATNSFAKVSILSTSGDITTDGTVDAGTIIFTGGSVTANDTITTSGSQAYTAKGTGDVILGPLNVGTTLKVTSKHNIVGTGDWVALGGRTTLKSTSTLASEEISVTGTGNNFLELHLTGKNATIESDNTISIAGGKISRAGLSAGITELTSFNGDVVQIGTATFETWHLIATATNAGASIDFSTGNLRVAELGALTADVDVTIVRGAPSTLKITDLITAGNDVVIVANHLISQANIDNDAGPNPITAGGRFLIYAYDESLSLALLTGISAPSYTPFGIRYSADPLAPGNPANIAGDFFVFFRA